MIASRFNKILLIVGVGFFVNCCEKKDDYLKGGGLNISAKEIECDFGSSPIVDNGVVRDKIPLIISIEEELLSGSGSADLIIGGVRFWSKRGVHDLRVIGIPDSMYLVNLLKRGNITIRDEGYSRLEPLFGPKANLKYLNNDEFLVVMKDDEYDSCIIIFYLKESKFIWLNPYDRIDSVGESVVCDLIGR